MKLMIGAALFFAFVSVQRRRKGRHVPTPRVLAAAFNGTNLVRAGMRYPHACEHCTPIAQYGRYDLYICQREKMPISVARYGARAADYVSSNDLSLPDEGIRVTFSRT